MARWYPNVSDAARSVQDALRRAFDFIWEVRESMLPTAVHARGSGDPHTIKIAVSPVPGVQAILPRDGRWAVAAAWSITVNDAAKLITGYLRLNGTAQLGTAFLKGAVGTVATIAQFGSFIASKGDTVSAAVGCEVDGTSTVDPTNSTIAAYWQGVS